MEQNNKTNKIPIIVGIAAGLGGFLGALIGSTMKLHWALTGLLAAVITFICYGLLKYIVK